MDILTHVFSGVAAGASVSVFSSHSRQCRLAIVVTGGVGGFVPDLDAISLWSGFDSTIGRLLGLSHSGKEIYSSKFWYSHHGFLHSMLASLIIALLIMLVVYAWKAKINHLTFIGLWKFLKRSKLFFIAFVVGYTFHLIGDMPTPSSTWGGVNLLWPLKSYVGGAGQIWWWNNYDIFLIITSVALFNICLVLLKSSISRKVRAMVVMVFLIGFILVVCQVNSRNFDFNYEGHTVKFYQFEQKSKEIQKELLGSKTYSFMLWLDSKLPFNF